MIVQTHTFKFKPMLTAVIIDGKPYFIVNDIADILDISSTYINANVPVKHLFQLKGREYIAKIKKIDSCVYRLNLIDKDGIFYLGNNFSKKVISHLTNPLVAFINTTIIPTAKRMYGNKIKDRKRVNKQQVKQLIEPKTEQKDLFGDERLDIIEDRIDSLESTVETQKEQIKFLLDELGIVYKKDNEKTIKALVDTLGLTVDQAQQLAQIGESIRKQGVK